MLLFSMAVMHIKNKYEVSLKELMRETKKSGGDPELIVIDQFEAWDILKEMRRVGKIRSEFEFTSDKHTAMYLEAAAIIWNGKQELNKDVATKLIVPWIRGDWFISIAGIPIRVQKKKTNAVAKPNGVPKPWYKRLFRG